VTPGEAPGELTASRVAAWPDGTVAEVVLNERTAAYARWHSGGAWGAWLFIADGVRDVSVCAGNSGEEPAALVSVVRFVPLPFGGIAARHVSRTSAFYRLTASGIVPADL
jgi:hypothetical protein